MIYKYIVVRGIFMIIRAKFLKKGILFACIGLAIGLTSRIIYERKTQDTFSDITSATVVCDAGHGMPDGGAVGVAGTFEQEINLAVTKKLDEVLESRGIEVVMTRNSDDGIYDEDSDTIRKKKVDDMHKRLDIINNSGADLFVSIHMNSFTDSSARGVHIFYNNDNEELKRAAEYIKNRIGDVTGAKVYDIKKASKDIYLMKNSQVPAILVECGFLSNPQEEQLLKDEEYQSKMAWAIADGIMEYLSSDA